MQMKKKKNTRASLCQQKMCFVLLKIFEKEVAKEMWSELKKCEIVSCAAERETVWN